jgi:hypothetical protein
MPTFRREPWPPYIRWPINAPQRSRLQIPSQFRIPSPGARSRWPYRPQALRSGVSGPPRHHPSTTPNSPPPLPWSLRSQCPPEGPCHRQGRSRKCGRRRKPRPQSDRDPGACGTRETRQTRPGSTKCLSFILFPTAGSPPQGTVAVLRQCRDRRLGEARHIRCCRTTCKGPRSAK